MKEYINNLWEKTIKPSLQKALDSGERNSEKIIDAIDSLENSTTSSQEGVVKSLENIPKSVEAYADKIEQAIKEKSNNDVVGALFEVKDAIKEKELTVNIGETVVDTQSVVKSIEALKKALPTIPTPIDYTLSIDSILEALTAPKEDRDYSKEFSDIKELLSSLGTSQDLQALAEWLQTITEKEETIYPFEFNKGRLKVEVDRAGGGGGGLTSIEATALVSIPQKQDELIAQQENHICTDNTTTTPLGAGGVFTGEWQDCLQFQEVNVSISTDQNSATDGLEIQWSDDGISISDTDKFTVYANAGTNYTPNPAFRYVRLKYTNGSVAQGAFHLMTILRRGVTGGSFHRITDTLKDDSDGRLNLSVLKLRTAANNYVSGSATNSGNFKVSLEEMESEVTNYFDEKFSYDTLSKYVIADKDDDASPNYYGFTDKEGNWYIMRETISSGADTYRYTKGESNYDTNWTNRASLTYDYFYNVFSV